MIRFDCDWCGRTKASDEVWILGLAAEAVGVTAARREITILTAWNRDTATHPLAVHFCCEECKDDYMAQLFNDIPALKSEIVIESEPSRRSGTKTRVSSSQRTKNRATRKKRAA